jgi:hypothetical protein
MKSEKMKLMLAIAGTIGCSELGFGQAIPNAEVQIKTALLASPEESRDKAMVYGYSPKGEFIVLRKGENEIICLADDPMQPGLSVSCYHKSLEPFMARGRELKKEGKTFQQIFDIREAEAKGGKLQLPKQPASLYVHTAPAENFNAETGEVKDGYSRSVIYIPYATAESTGLPAKPGSPGMPWIMNPGTARAHIMIDPPVKK